ncbi:lytic transglycosylase domain-containing protein [Brevibacillus laterosporus]|uniref:lytic transglycosylase domain-containing protein n=1 Tax=Brevibacillus laterosporus TaxID=1465 RepID=UPI00264E840C|nr:transglycosylase SLT domain-containing protein [Brevibacillus laterosporus]MDN9009076.1 transglycosylase SLT domain-containing protein [Brevibacillus laterosporus]MDO0942529.1 transglycosylase SLT domain-containing protein [Brevibacillus laterosporus]
MIIGLKFIIVILLTITELSFSNLFSQLDNISAGQRNTVSFVTAASIFTQQQQMQETIIHHMTSKNISITEATKLSNYILTFSEKYKVDPFLIVAIIEVESYYHPNLIGKHKDTGLMQILPSTQKYMGIKGELTDPEVNIQVGCKYLAYTQSRFGPELGIIAYNQGEGNIVRGTFKTHYLIKVKKVWSAIKNKAFYLKIGGL